MNCHIRTTKTCYKNYNKKSNTITLAIRNNIANFLEIRNNIVDCLFQKQKYLNFKKYSEFVFRKNDFYFSSCYKRI
jgi:hypothetical protein